MRLKDDQWEPVGHEPMSRARGRNFILEAAASDEQEANWSDLGF
jgi:hypothetical protein